jgi:hypothetical protein
MSTKDNVQAGFVHDEQAFRQKFPRASDRYELEGHLRLPANGAARGTLQNISRLIAAA